MPSERSAPKCVHPHALDADWGSQQGVAHTRAQLAGIPPSTPQHEEGVWRQSWRVCVVVVVWATGRHAWCGGHGQLRSWSAWIPPVPCQEKRENEGGRGSQRVSRCDLCCHCMSMLMKKEKEGEGDTHLACSCCCPFGCLPATALCWCATHTHPSFFSSSPPLCGIMHTVHVHACLCQCPVCST